MQKFLNKRKLKVLISSLAFLVLFSCALYVFAVDPAPPVGGYLPNTATDPGCSPGDPDCFVANSNWSLTGNVSTTDGTNFIGTTDDVPLNFRVDNTPSGRIDHAMHNTFFGFQGGITNTTGTKNTIIGDQADLNFNNLTNATAIGYNAKVNASNTIQLGDANILNINSSGTLTLGTEIYPNTDGTPGQILSTNGFGVLGWIPAPLSFPGFTNLAADYNFIAGINYQTPLTANVDYLTPATAALTYWSLLGNTGTTDGTNFIGTNDNVALNFKVNTQQAGRIDPKSENTFFGLGAGSNYTGATSSVTNITVDVGGTGYNPLNTTITIVPPTSGVTATATPIISVAQDEIQTVSLTAGSIPDAGTYTITFAPNTTAPLNFNDNSATIQTALENLGNIGVGNILITGDMTTSINLHFTGALANTPEPLITIDSSSLRKGGNPLASPPAVSESQLGVPTSGIITGVTITNHGSGYTSVPGVSIVGGNNDAVMTAQVSIGTGNYNTAFGYSSLSANTTGADNTAYGIGTLFNNTIGFNNTAIGVQALKGNVDGGDNTAYGVNALFGNTSGSNNTASGYNSLVSNLSGSFNTALGYQADVGSGALANATALGANAIVTTSNTIQLGDTNVTKINSSGTLTLGAVTYPNTDGTAGYVLTTNGTGQAGWADGSIGKFTTDGKGNMFVLGTGAGASLFSSFGITNLFVGTSSGQSTTTGSNNTASGYRTLYANDMGGYNTADGFEALYSNIGGNNNTATGDDALYSNISGSFNTADGFETLFSNVTGSYNTAIGFEADTTGPSADNLSNATAIGKNAKVGASNSLVLGGTGADAVKVGVGTTTPSNVLDVIGKAGDTTVVSIGTISGNTCTFNTGINPGVWSCASDVRLKNSITSIDSGNALLEINQLNPVMFHYNWQEPTDPLIPGFIAQEFENVFPNMVSTDPTTGYKSLSYTPLIPYTVKAIQELDLKLEDLTNTATPLIDINNQKTFMGRFFDRLVVWFGDAKNGIEDLYANIIHTKKLCVADDSGAETCLTKAQLDGLLLNANTISPTPTPTPIPTPDPNSIPVVEPAPTTDPVVDSTTPPTPTDSTSNSVSNSN